MTLTTLLAVVGVCPHMWLFLSAREKKLFLADVGAVEQSQAQRVTEMRRGFDSSASFAPGSS